MNGILILVHPLQSTQSIMTSHAKFKFLSATLFCAALMPACAMDEGKGEEDSLDAFDTKSDSFHKPTEHGTLLFGAPQSARLAKDSLFHTWDFELSDDASVTLATKLITTNLDTVLYLYKKNTETGNYGSYLFRNDDANNDTVASELIKDLEKGQYRVLIKGFKSSLRGSFTLAASCEGAGCATSTCDTEVFAALPGFVSDSCGELFSDSLDGDLTSSSRATVELDQRCTLPSFASNAVEFYVDYFGGEDEFNEIFDFGGPIELNVNWDVYASGAAYISIDTGGDEDGLDFLVSGEGTVIAHYQHNQSPDHTLYCDDGEDFLEDGDCFFEYVADFPHAQSAEREFNETVDGSDAKATLNDAAFIAYQAYVAELGLSASRNVTLSGATWKLSGSDIAGRIQVKAGGKKHYHYEVAAANGEDWQFTVQRGASADKSYDCKTL